MSENISLNEQEHILNERININYDIKDKIFDLELKNIEGDIELKEAKKQSMIYPNQEECSEEIVKLLDNKKNLNVMCIALTQSGKTGAMCALIKNYKKTNLIPIENIYIITGLSSREWKEQTKTRMPKLIEERVFHRDNLSTKFVDDVKDKKNVLIIIDEIQTAAQENQTIHKTFNEIGFYNKQKLFKDDIKIVEFTATPDGNIYDLIDWGENACKLRMDNGDDYKNIFDLLEEGRVKQYFDIEGYNKETGEIDESLINKNIGKIKKDIDKYDKKNQKLYHIIRTPCGNGGTIVIDNFKTIFGNDIKIYKYDRDSVIKDINSILVNKPKDHEFIFIKEKLRCAKTIIKKYLGVVFERYTQNPDDSVIIQGLVGRGTGYDDNKKSIYYTNIPSIKKYKKLWDSNFENNSVRWISKTTTMVKQMLKSKGTYHSPKLFNNESEGDSNQQQDDKIINEFNTFNKLMVYFKLKLKPVYPKSNGPQKLESRKINEYGFYLTSFGKNKQVVASYKEIFESRNWYLKNNFRCNPCYKDTKNKETLVYCLIHRKL